MERSTLFFWRGLFIFYYKKLTKISSCIKCNVDIYDILYIRKKHAISFFTNNKDSFEGNPQNNIARIMHITQIYHIYPFVLYMLCYVQQVFTIFKTINLNLQMNYYADYVISICRTITSSDIVTAIDFTLNYCKKKMRSLNRQHVIHQLSKHLFWLINAFTLTIFYNILFFRLSKYSAIDIIRTLYERYIKVVN